MFETVNDLPEDVRRRYTPEQQAAYLRIYNEVFGQTQDPVKAQSAAIGAVIKMDVNGVQVLRSAPNGNPIIGGWAMKFSDPSDTDSYDTFFALASKLFLDYYPTAPLWWEHGLDNDYGSDPIGRRVKSLIFGFGVWLEHELYRSHFRFEDTYQAVQNGEVSYSSDSIQHYAEQGFNQVNGRMDIWPFAGCALTRTPAEQSLGPVVEMVALRAFNAKVLTLFSDISSGLEAQVAREQSSEAQQAQRTSETLLPVRKSSQGDTIMDPQQLAALAEFFGCDATPQAVMAACQQLITQLQQQPADPTGQADQEAMMSQLRAAFGLASDCKPQDVVAKVENIRSLLAPARSKLRVGALKRFVSLVEAEAEETPAEDDLPHFSPGDDGDEEGDEDDAPPARRSGWGRSDDADRRHDRQVSFRHNRGSKKPGFLDMIGAITQVMGGSVTFEMPAFKSQRTSPKAALRAMNINSGPNGGWMVNREMSDELLEALYAREIFDKLGVRYVPMNGIESITMNRVGTGATAYWVGADQTVTDSGNPQVQAAVTLNLKELVCELPVQNRLLQNSSMKLEQFITDDILKVMRLKRELAFLYGTGGVPAAAGNSGAEPLGIYNTTGIIKTALGNKAPTIDNLIDAEGRIEDANYDYDKLGWVSHNRARRLFKKMKDSDGHPIFMEDYVKGGVREMELMGWDFATTTQIPITTSQTDMFLGDWSGMLIGEGQDFEITIDTSILMRKRQTLIQVVGLVDSGVAYKEAFQILTGVKV